MQRLLPSFIFFLLFIVIYTVGYSQRKDFSRQDSLRGTLSPFRASYDVNFYDLSLQINIDKKAILGSNKIYFTSISSFDSIQIDLFSNLILDSILYKNKKLPFTRDGNAVFIKFPETIHKGNSSFIEVFYHGQPIVAANAPWDGGFVWKTDSLGRPWIGVACEGVGASLWWPNKDHLSDEPDSMRMVFEIPSNLYCVANGNLRCTKALNNGNTKFEWFVNYPINTYNVTLNIGNYAHISDYFIRSDQDSLKLDFYILDYNLSKAKKHFKQVDKILTCYEKLFGKYPFPKDGYALVETPYWGMEHQGAIAYGNNYVNNMLSLDYIIVHETAHEWWGNSVSVKDHAEMWIHEAFATYSEALLLECLYNKEIATKYLLYQQKNIKNKEPILGPLNVNYHYWEGSDMYFKGAWMLHTLRHVFNNDSLWYKTIFNLAENNKLSIVESEEVINFFSKSFGQDLTYFFKQYLNFPSRPTLEYKIKKVKGKLKLLYRWNADVQEFKMPVDIILENDKITRIFPNTSFKSIDISKNQAKQLKVQTEKYYINVKQIH